MFAVLAILFLITSNCISAFEWRIEDDGVIWAQWCDFPGNDIRSVGATSNACGPICKETKDCTHFAWSTADFGKCWLKRNGVSRSQARGVSGLYTVCGTVP